MAKTKKNYQSKDYYNEKKFKKYATEEQVNLFKNALRVGSPITIALSYAGIPTTTYYYWVSIASIVKYCEEMEVIFDNEDKVKSGVDLMEVKNEALLLNAPNNQDQKKSSSISTYIEPTTESIRRYCNNPQFNAYCHDIYKLMCEFDRCRAEIVMFHLDTIRKSTGQTKKDTRGSQWFLEKTLPEYFGRVGSKNDDDEESNSVPSVKVEFVDPNTKESVDRVKQMEKDIDNQLSPLGKDIA